jgi:hypothetical protein
MISMGGMLAIINVGLDSAAKRQRFKLEFEAFSDTLKVHGII